MTNNRKCFGTTEFSKVSFICKGCPNFLLCEEVKPKIVRHKRPGECKRGSKKWSLTKEVKKEVSN